MCVCVFVFLELYYVVDQFAVLTYVVLTTLIEFTSQGSYFCHDIGMSVVNILIRYLVFSVRLNLNLKSHCDGRAHTCYCLPVRLFTVHFVA